MLELLWYFSGVQNMPELRVSLCDVSKIDYSCIFWLISLITLKFCSTSNADEQKTLHFVYQAVLFVLLKLSIVESPMGIISWGLFLWGDICQGDYDSSSSSFLACNSRLRSAIRRHHPPQRAVLSQICCFGERKMMMFQILLDLTGGLMSVTLYFSLLLVIMMLCWTDLFDYHSTVNEKTNEDLTQSFSDESRGLPQTSHSTEQSVLSMECVRVDTSNQLDTAEDCKQSWYTVWSDARWKW